MATVKVFTVKGVKELRCFDTIDDVPFLPDQEVPVTEEDDLDDE